MYVWEGGLKGYISVCNSDVLSYMCVYVRVQSSLCVCVSGAGLLYENRGPLSTRLFRAPVFLQPNSGSTPALVWHSDRAQILRDNSDQLTNSFIRVVNYMMHQLFTSLIFIG